MIKIATFDFLDYLDLQRRILFFPTIGALSPQLELSGYDTAYFSLCMGTLFFIVVIGLGTVLIGATTYLVLHLTRSLQHLKAKIGEINISNTTIRFLIEGYFEFTLSLAVNIKMLYILL